MTENRENWLYPDASGLYFSHNGFIMRATDGKQYDIDEECELLNELHNKNKELKRQVKETIFDINALIDVSAPNTEKISVLLDLKEKIIETFGEWVIE